MLERTLPTDSGISRETELRLRALSDVRRSVAFCKKQNHQVKLVTCCTKTQRHYMTS